MEGRGGKREDDDSFNARAFVRLCSNDTRARCIISWIMTLLTQVDDISHDSSAIVIDDQLRVESFRFFGMNRIVKEATRSPIYVRKIVITEARD